MRVTGWAIEGFGIFRSLVVENLPDGLVVFQGPNEAGKSTLLAFLRNTLFGFRGGSRSPQYPPLNGGRHGGRVFLLMREGPVTVERIAKRPARITFADGTELDDVAFQQRIGGVDYQIFSTVFAFSLDELRD
ncbi:MAG: AAA family ATPase, partial [Thermoleophilia bacterium]|nr:AAA family ATPase [Thermoleophilia bacterium]